MAEDAEEEEEEIFPAGLPVPLSTLRGGTRYSAWVQASNALGAARSPPRRLDLQELGMSIRPSVRPSVHLGAALGAGAVRGRTRRAEMSL